MKILLLDIETAPNLVTVWGLWNQNVATNQILDAGYVLCYAAKWLGEDEVFFDSIYHSSEKHMLKGVYSLIEEADVIIHYNGTKFDMPTLNKEFLLNGMLPPAPYKQIDLLKTARAKFRFPSNKLDYITQALGLGGKTKHPGHQLWLDCMAKKAEAWDTMREYNIQDVILLERLYNTLKPWIPNHPNHNLYNEANLVCPTCGGKHHQKRGYTYTNACKYQRYQCQDCGGWFRGITNLGPKPADKFQQVNV